MALLRAALRALPLLVLSQAVCGMEGAGTLHRVAADPGLGFKLHLFAPPRNDSLPVIFFVSGVGGEEPVFTYSELLTQVADRGFVVVGVDRLGLLNYPQRALDFLRVLGWAQSGRLQALMLKQGLSAVPDVEQRSVVMAHSEGNHVIGQALVDDCSVAKAWVMIDPVDGYDPYRFVRSEDLITPGRKLNFTIPALILDNGLDPRPVSRYSPACVPYEMGTTRFFPAMRGPVWNVNATAYGHLDCQDPAFDFRWFCSTNPAADKVAYRAFLADTAALFFKSLLEGRPTDLQRLADPESFGVNVTLRQNLQGLALKDVRAGCSGGGGGQRAGEAGPSLLV